MNAKLTQVLEAILQDKQLVPAGQRLTVIFDRGGLSAKLFARLITLGFDFITYRKGKRRTSRVALQQTKIADDGQAQSTGCATSRGSVWALASAPPTPAPGRGPGYLWLREVRVARADGGQTPILTNRADLSAVAVACRMFRRWRQENFFKYMAEEFALDALAEYGAEDLSAGWIAPIRKRSR